MKPLAYHVNFRALQPGVLTPDAPACRAFARGVLKASLGLDLLAFRAADTHTHLEVVGTAEEAHELVRRVKIQLYNDLGLQRGFGPAHYEPIESQRHLQNAFWYILAQSDHHGFQHDPLAEASNLPDLLGARTCGTWTAGPVRRHLPRVDRQRLLATLGVEALVPLVPELDALADLAAAAIGVARLDRRTPEQVAARCAAVHAAPGSAPAIARALDTHPRTVERLRARDADPALVRAIQLQACLQAAIPSPPLLFADGPFPTAWLEASVA